MHQHLPGQEETPARGHQDMNCLREALPGDTAEAKRGNES